MLAQRERESEPVWSTDIAPNQLTFATEVLSVWSLVGVPADSGRAELLSARRRRECGGVIRAPG
jgi:hypothetical protein